MGAYKIIAVSCKAKDLKKYLQLFVMGVDYEKRKAREVKNER